jgi:hypothetical protein
MYLKLCFLGSLLAGACPVASAYTLTCNYGAHPSPTPPGTSNPTVYSRLDWTTSEQAHASGIFFSSVAYDPNSTLIGSLQTDIPLPQPVASWFSHVVVVGSPFPVGEWSVTSQAYAYQWFFFEGVWYRLLSDIPKDCSVRGHIP